MFTDGKNIHKLIKCHGDKLTCNRLPPKVRILKNKFKILKRFIIPRIGSEAMVDNLQGTFKGTQCKIYIKNHL